ncbi:MAG TPA: hypothetical protein VL793_15095 [Patescibacteria group bacterium]|nr:hypothetical protein [Patescibacteria group bacterium]
MRIFYSLLLGAVFFLQSTSRAATETARATIWCYSFQFQRGSESGGNYYLSLTSVSGSVNGELALDFLASGYTHSAYLSLEDDLFGETLSGQMGLDVPTGGDANGDGFPDFFQVSQPVNNLSSSGAYNLDIYGNGTVSATWNRDAGSSYGTCTLTMALMPFDTVTFVHTFQVLEYNGPLTYTTTSSNVTGMVNLVQTNNPSAMMLGPVTFVKSTVDRFNSLTLQAGVWTNESQQAVFFLNDVYSRDAGWPTNYYGYLDFTDPANPNGFYPYGSWLLSIDDTNDFNHNGIPDFSDDPSGSAQPRSPQLLLSQNGTNLVMTLHGDVGFINDIQTTSDLGSPNWQTALSVTVTNDPQDVVLPAPSAAVTFWRVKAR